MHAFPPKWSQLRTVLVHDWLTGMRGGERVLELLCEGFPDASILALIHTPEAISAAINRHPIRTSWLQGLPNVGRSYRYFLPLFPLVIETLRAPDADLVISTSHCVAKGIRKPRGARHLCYCFTPIRYAWTFFDEYFGSNPAKALLARPMLSALRAWDRRSSARVDRFVAISRHVQQRIRAFYGRPADVVYPPVDTERCTPDGRAPGDFDLIVSALVPYKRLDLAVRAYTRLRRPLKIVGIGTERARLERLAGPNVEFLGWRPDPDVVELYRACRLLVFPGEEDFGIVPLEAQACGRPVVAYGRGGVLESVQEGSSGVFFREQTEEALIEAVGLAARIRWDPQAIRANALQFTPARFIAGIAASIEKCLAGAPEGDA